MANEKLPVIFKKHFERGFGWDVTAFFPTLPADYQGYLMTCYQHIGQHSGASFDFFWQGKKCQPEEYEDLLAELRRIYEHGDDVNYDLVVYQKMTRKHRDQFEEEARKIRKRG